MSEILDFRRRTGKDGGTIAAADADHDFGDDLGCWPGGPSYIGVLLDTLLRCGIRDTPGGAMETLTNQTLDMPAVDADFDAAFIEFMLGELGKRGVFEGTLRAVRAEVTSARHRDCHSTRTGQ